jgi:hypothetical protein
VEHNGGNTESVFTSYASAVVDVAKIKRSARHDVTKLELMYFATGPSPRAGPTER